MDENMKKRLMEVSKDDLVFQISQFGDEPEVLERFSKMSLAELNAATVENKGLSYLLYATSSHKVAMIKLLLEKGMDPNALNHKGRGGMILNALGCIDERNGEILRLFLEHGVDLDQPIHDSTVRKDIYSFQNEELIKIIEEFEAAKKKA